MHENARSALLVIGLMGSTCVASNTGQTDAAPALNAVSGVSGPPSRPPDSVESAVTAAYAREFSETIARPAIYNDPSGGGCTAPHLTTTAYVRTSSTTGRLLYLMTTPDGRVVARKSRVESVVLPAGSVSRPGRHREASRNDRRLHAPALGSSAGEDQSRSCCLCRLAGASAEHRLVRQHQRARQRRRHR